MIALQPLPSFVSSNAQRQSVLRSQLFQFGNNARGDDRVALGVQAVHHGLQKRQFSLNCVTEKVGIDEDVVGRDESGVMLEEHVAGHLRRFADELAVGRLLCLFF